MVVAEHFAIQRRVAGDVLEFPRGAENRIGSVVREEEHGGELVCRIFFPAEHRQPIDLNQRVAKLVRDGESSCEVSVPQWDFHWQGMYFYEQPLVVDAADTLHVTCTYDTTDATEPVLPGWGTQNEMCLMGLFVVPVL